MTTKPITRTCQMCHGRAVRNEPGWWECYNCGLAWRVGVNPLAARRKQAKAAAERRPTPSRAWPPVDMTSERVTPRKTWTW